MRGYPRIPHLWGSQAGDDDIVLEPRETRVALSRPVKVYEKLDGLNVGLRFRRPGDLRFISRIQGELRPEELAPDLRPMAWWGLRTLPRLWSVLGSRYAAYGEWLQPRIGVHYTALPDLLIFFDLMDLERRTFVRRDAVGRRLESAGFHVNRLRFHDRLHSIDELPRVCSASSYGAGAVEGWILTRGSATYKVVRRGYRAVPASWLGRAQNRTSPASRYRREPSSI